MKIMSTVYYSSSYTHMNIMIYHLHKAKKKYIYIYTPATQRRRVAINMRASDTLWGGYN